MIGETILHYNILEKLGEGGMGVVYLAEDTKLERKVAIKFLPRHIAGTFEERERFKIEAKAAASLNHPNISTIHSIEESGDETFIVMEYIDGIELKDKIKSGSIPTKEAVNIAIQIAEGLEAAHKKGIIHRDIKSQNIMISDDGKVKVMDFGLAKMKGKAQLTKAGSTLGTLEYMAPEQAKGEEVDQQSDIWSFGVVLYEMLTGKMPFAGDYDASVIYNILNDEPSLDNIQDSVLQLILKKCLEKEKTNRYQSVTEILKDLRIDKQISGEKQAVKVEASKKKSRLPVFIISVVSVIVLAVIAYFIFFGSEKKTENLPSMQAPLNIVPLTRYTGTENFPSFSPDGNQVAFDWDGPNGDNTDIYIKVIGTESISRLTTDVRQDFHPRWSPDGRMIAYKQYINIRDYKVYLVSPLGGPVRKLADVIGPVRFNNWEKTLDWDPNGKFIVVNGPEGDGEPASLFMISVQTGERNRLTNPPSDISSTFGDSKAVFSNDGRKLVFVRMVSEDVGDLYLLELSESGKAVGKPQRITFQKISHYGAVFLPGDKEIVYSAGSSLWRLSLSDNSEPKLIMQIEGLTEIALSHQGDKLAYVKERSSSNIVRVAISEKRMVIEKPGILIPSTVTDLSPRYSPDGKKIAFYSTRTGHGEVWTCDANGSNLLQLTSYDNWTGGPNWSPDGKFLVIDSRIEGQSEIYIIPSDGGQVRRLTDNPAEDHWPYWSKDGKWIYFSSTRTGQQEEIWKVSIDGKKELQLTKNGGTAPKESPDEQMVYFQKFNSGLWTSLWRVPVNGGNEMQILERSYLSCFEIVKNGIYFIAPTETDNRAAIQFLSFKTGKTKIIHKIEDNDISVGLSVSPDQKSILYIKENNLGSDIDIIENFR